jgi:octaprenyl-diphosphate synthase
MTLPLIYTLAQSDRRQRRHIINIVRNESDRSEKVAEVIALVRQSGGLEYARQAMYRYRQEALDLLEGFPDHPARRALSELLMFVTERAK